MMREAVAGDAEAIATLLSQLGPPVQTASVRQQIETLRKTGCDRVLVAERESVAVGVLSLHWTPLLHRDPPLGRITVLVVDEKVRGRGIGRELVTEAERILSEAGCSAVEVTSNLRRADAHEFYRGLGYEQPSAHFRRSLSETLESKKL